MSRCDSCTDRHGKPKRLYASWEDASEAAAHILQVRGVHLRVYSCPYTWGFHLTSKLRSGQWDPVDRW